MQPAGSADTGYTNTCAIGEQDCPTGEQPNADLATCAVNATDVSVFPTRPGNGLLIGQFRLADGRTGAHHTMDATVLPRASWSECNATPTLL